MKNIPTKFKVLSTSRLLVYRVYLYLTSYIKCIDLYEQILFPEATTRKQAKAPGQRYQLLLQPVLMRISTGCKSSWYLWPAAIKGKGFGTG